MMVYHNMVAGAQQQGFKKYCDMGSHPPRGELIQKMWRKYFDRPKVQTLKRVDGLEEMPELDW